MRGKPADITNHTDSFAILWISVTRVGIYAMWHARVCVVSMVWYGIWHRVNCLLVLLFSGNNIHAVIETTHILVTVFPNNKA